MYTVLPRILCVDDEPHVLEVMARNLARHFDVTVARGGEEGLDRVEREGPFAVVMSDQRMPGLDGVSFLAKVRESSPDTVRILLTGYADTAAAMAAVNRGAVFRFLSKPVEIPELVQTLTAGVEQHRLVTSERVLLERTLHGSINAIIDVLALMNPAAFGRALRSKEIVNKVAAAVEARDSWQIEIAAMISQVGSAAMTPGAGRPATPEGFAEAESAAVGRLSKIAADMVVNIPRMEEVHAMLLHQDLRYDGSNGAPGAPRGESIPFGARVLKVAFDLDTLEGEGMSRGVAVEAMRGRVGWYDPQLLDALVAEPVLAPAPAPQPVVQPAHADVELRHVAPGMVLGEAVLTGGGRVLIAPGEIATRESIQRMKNALDFNALRKRVRVTPPTPPAPVSAPDDSPAPASANAGGIQLDLTMRLTV